MRIDGVFWDPTVSHMHQLVVVDVEGDEAPRTTTKKTAWGAVGTRDKVRECAQFLRNVGCSLCGIFAFHAIDRGEVAVRFRFPEDGLLRQAQALPGRVGVALIRRVALQRTDLFWRSDGGGFVVSLRDGIRIYEPGEELEKTVRVV